MQQACFTTTLQRMGTSFFSCWPLVHRTLSSGLVCTSRMTRNFTQVQQRWWRMRLRQVDLYVCEHLRSGRSEKRKLSFRGTFCWRFLLEGILVLHSKFALHEHVAVRNGGTPRYGGQAILAQFTMVAQTIVAHLPIVAEALWYSLLRRYRL